MRDESRLEIRTFGGLSILLDGNPVKGFASKKVEALLIYLVCKEQPQHREILAELLWDERSQERATGNLRVVLSSLRKKLGGFFDITRETVRVNPEATIWVDVTELEKHFKNAQVFEPESRPGKRVNYLENAVELYEGRFLEGFFVRDCQGFENWTFQEGERFQRLILDALMELVSYFSEIGVLNKGLAYTSRLLEMDPLIEKAHQHMMRLLALNGQREAALKQYETCCQILREELDVEPSEDTGTLYQKIKAGEFNVPRPVLMPPVSPKRTPRRRKIPDNLPSQRTSFVGREQELLDILSFYQSPNCRLVTLTGPGGVGKTRLALQAARELLHMYPDGVYLVDLAPVSDPELLPSRIASVLGMKEGGSRSLIDDLKEHLFARQTLLVLDNLEQILDASPVISELLVAAPGLDILVTSREVLHLYGEHEYPVPPMNLPDKGGKESLEEISNYESVALFTQRALAAKADFQLNLENVRQVADICIRLDGLPLAIELAAARVKMLPPNSLLARLSDSLNTLTGGPRDISTRHQTLRAAIEWSFNLLDEIEKELFVRLAVFNGGWSLEAVEAVCEVDLQENNLFGKLESLVNKSLLNQREGVQGEQRFAFLETVHQYAHQRLERYNQKNIIRGRHAGFFVELAERAGLGLRGPGQDTWSAILREDYDNLRTALAWSFEDGDPEIGVRLVGALSEFWYYEGPLSDGEKWMEEALKLKEYVSQVVYASVLNGAGMLAFARGDHERGRVWNQQALAIASEIQDKSNWGWALFWLSAHATSDPNLYWEGIKLCEEALTLFREMDEKPGLAWGYNQLGELSRLVEDYSRAGAAYEDSLVLCRETGNMRREAIALINMSYVAQHLGDFSRAERLILDGLALLQELQLKYHSGMALAMLAGPVAAQGDALRATKLLGASEAIFKRMSVSLQPADQVEVDRFIDIVRNQLDLIAFEKAMEDGRALSYEKAIAFAFESDGS